MSDTDHATQIERAELLVDVPGNRAGLVPFVDVGRDLGGDEFCDGLAIGGALGGVERVLHRRRVK